MRLQGRIIIAVLVSALAACGPSCTGSRNRNQQNANQTAGRQPGRWMAQWRSSYSAGYGGTRLALFAYSSISVVSSSVVFVAGDMPNPKDQSKHVGVVVHTTNGGQTWTETVLDQLAKSDIALNSIHFVNPNVGWIVGATGEESKREGVLLKTTDGGNTWAVTKTPYKQIPTSVFFVDEETGWMGGSTSYVATNPPTGGASSALNQPAGSSKVSGKKGSPAKAGKAPENENEEEVEGGPSDIIATTDGGSTWHSQIHLSTSINDIFFLDKDKGWAGGYKGAIYRTTDGGRVWSQQRSELEFNERFTDPKNEDAKNFIVSGIHFFDANNGLAAASAADEDLGRILGTSNGGTAWGRKLVAQGESIRDVFLLSPTEGWAIPTYPKYVYHTIDGGRYWEGENVIFDQEVPFFRVAAADSLHVWAVGGGAIFYRIP